MANRAGEWTEWERGRWDEAAKTVLNGRKGPAEKSGLRDGRLFVGGKIIVENHPRRED